MTPLALAVGLGAVLTYYVVAWLIAEFLEKLSLVDVAWAFSFPLIFILYVSMSRTPAIRWVPLMAMITLWSVRLGTHLTLRIIESAPYEDFRLESLRQRWIGRFNPKFLGLFLTRAALTYILSLPFWLTLHNPVFILNPIECAAIGLWYFAWRGEWVADRQLARFRADPSNKGKTCREGLWRYSRHPNYFFELLVWCSFALYATGTPWGWLSWIAPLIMAVILVSVNGIPLVEWQAQRHRQDDYPKYQQTTSALIPFFPGNRVVSLLNFFITR